MECASNPLRSLGAPGALLKFVSGAVSECYAFWTSTSYSSAASTSVLSVNSHVKVSSVRPK